MNLHAATRICAASKGALARPASWKGRGWALDLGGKFDTKDTGKIRAISPLSGSGHTFRTDNWFPKTEELLEEWFLISVSHLAEEAREIAAQFKPAPAVESKVNGPY